MDFYLQLPKTEASYGIGYGGTTPPNFITGEGGGPVNEGIYTPLSTIAQAGVGFTGTHLNLMGLDPTSPMSGITDGGLFPGAGLNTYLGTIRAKNDETIFSTKTETYTVQVPNPLFAVANALPLILGSEGQSSNNSEPEFIDEQRERIVTNEQSDFSNRLIDLHANKISVKNNDPDIISYSGGPGSILGVGKTHIRFADQRTGVNNPLSISDPGFFSGASSKDRYTLMPESKDFVSK